MTQLTTFYVAKFEQRRVHDEVQVELMIYRANFERKPKGWKRVQPTNGARDDAHAFGYKTVFNGDLEPGERSEFDAVAALRSFTVANIHYKESMLAKERANEALASNWLMEVKGK